VIRVAVLGLGVIGKRVVRAVRAQPDMRLTAVVLRSPSPAALATSGLPVFAFDEAAAGRLRRAGLRSAGGLADALTGCDVVVDCGPGGSGATRHADYGGAGVRVVYCGGERSPALGPLVHPRLNPRALATGVTHRVPSCNTTAVSRLLSAAGRSEITELDLVVLKCCTDNDKAGKGGTNGTRLGGGHTHHGDDLQEMCPGVRVRSVAASVPMTSGHVIHVRAHTADPLSDNDLMARLDREPRITTHEGPGDLDTSILKDAQWRRQWHDRYELVVRPVAARRGRTHELWLVLDNEAITIPELMDVVRCSGSGSTEPDEARTNLALGIGVDHRSTRTS
jgi:glyceraldehyde-3-phosphate dehydrogenase (NAD(P))